MRAFGGPACPTLGGLLHELHSSMMPLDEKTLKRVFSTMSPWFDFFTASERAIIPTIGGPNGVSRIVIAGWRAVHFDSRGWARDLQLHTARFQVRPGTMLSRCGPHRYGN